jgi:hypothetical protein
VARGPFSAHRDGSIGCRLPGGLRRVLAAEMHQLDELLTTTAAPAAGAAPPDPLAELTGMTSLEDRAVPVDPALRRLRPEAYAAEVDDGRAADEYRRLAGGELEALQRARVRVVLDSLSRGDRFDLDQGEAQSWVGALNDLRLMLGSRLGIVDDVFSGVEPSPVLQLFLLLGELLHTLLVALGAPDDL